MIQLFAYAFALLVVLTVIAAGAYIGALRALDVYFGGQASIFLSDNRQRSQPDEVRR